MAASDSVQAIFDVLTANAAVTAFEPVIVRLEEKEGLESNKAKPHLFIIPVAGPPPIPEAGTGCDEKRMSIAVIIRGAPRARADAWALALAVWDATQKPGPIALPDPWSTSLNDQGQPFRLAKDDKDRYRFSVNTTLLIAE